MVSIAYQDGVVKWFLVLILGMTWWPYLYRFFS